MWSSNPCVVQYRRSRVTSELIHPFRGKPKASFLIGLGSIRSPWGNVDQLSIFVCESTIAAISERRDNCPHP